MKNHFSEYQKNDFDFNQEIDYDKPSRSPGWERLKQAKKNISTFNRISYSNNTTIIKVGESVTHDDFGNGKVIHIEELPKDNINMKNHFSEYQKNDFDFNQEIDYDKPKLKLLRSYMESIKQSKVFPKKK